MRIRTLLVVGLAALPLEAISQTSEDRQVMMISSAETKTLGVMQEVTAIKMRTNSCVLMGKVLNATGPSMGEFVKQGYLCNAGTDSDWAKSFQRFIIQ
jgi:hypothetical protein